MSDAAVLEQIERNFRKRIRMAAEGPSGKYSSTWMFWGHAEDFYFGAKNLAGSLKVSLHKNGFGYLAYDRLFYKRMVDAGKKLPAKTIHQWKLPAPQITGAVQLAVVRLPADYCSHEASSGILRKKVLVLGVESKCSAEIGVFASYEEIATLEHKFLKIGRPLFAVTLENKMIISIVVRSAPFDSSVLPTNEHLNRSRKTELVKFDQVGNRDNLNMVVWNGPSDGEVLQVVDIGGIKIAPN
jgi:hypothetical protein